MGRMLMIGVLALLTWVAAGATEVGVFILDGRSMMPLRYATESFGAVVTYNSHTRDIDLTLAYQKVRLAVDRPVAYVDGKETVLDVCPVVVAGVTYVPARFISVTFGAQITWDAPAHQVIIIHPHHKKHLVLAIRSTPPGLAKKPHGMPPGQWKKMHDPPPGHKVTVQDKFKSPEKEKKHEHGHGRGHK